MSTTPVEAQRATEAETAAMDVLANRLPNRGRAWYLAVVREFIADPRLDPLTATERDMLAAYRAAEHRQIAAVAVRQFRERTEVNAAQQRRASQGRALCEAADWLHAQWPSLSVEACARLVVGIVTRYTKARSEMGPLAPFPKGE